MDILSLPARGRELKFLPDNFITDPYPSLPARECELKSETAEGKTG